ncbi:MAG TPA: transposase [Acidobacteriaceae bacterium]
MKRAPQSQRTYFLTFVTILRRKLFHAPVNAELMLATLQDYRAQGKFSLHAFVVMSDHVHVLVTPTENVSLERVVQLIKGGFSFRFKSRMDIWERGHFPERLKDWDGYNACVRYIENNPVRAGIVSEAEQYPFSSASRKDLSDPAPKELM